MNTTLEEAQTSLVVAQSRAREQANRSRRQEAYEEGSEVVLSTRNLRVDQHLPTKIRRRWIGPFKVLKVISPVAYKLDLPPTWRIHPVFHVSNLKRYHRSTEFERTEKPPPPVMVEGEEEYEVEAILRHKGTKSRRLYLVLWKGYPVTEASWEPESNLQHAPRILEDYLRRIATVDGKQVRTRKGKSTK